MPLTEGSGRGLFVLNYGTYSRIRVDDSVLSKQRFEERFDALREQGTLVRWDSDTWSPEADARNRTLEAKQKVQPGRVSEWRTRFGSARVPIPPNLWDTGVQDERVIRDFELLMTEVLGRWTAAYMEKFDSPPKSEWLVSVAIHLLLNSIGCTGPDNGFEPGVRLTPPL